MKIGVLTFHFAHNCGAMLQAYALSCYLKKIGHDAELIDYRPSYMYDSIKRYSLKDYITKQCESYGWGYGILRTLRYYYSHYKKTCSWNCFEFFLNNYINKSPYVNNASEINKLDYDIVICGSDQIWNSKITGGIVPIYYCDGLSDSVKKITYAASCGSDIIDEKQKSYVIKLLDNFDYISVREKGFSETLWKLGIKNQLVIDPVFLLREKDWDIIVKKPNIHNYVLAFSFRESPHFFEKSYAIAKQKNMVLVYFSFNKQKNLPKDVIQFTDGGPQDFIGFIKYANVVITNSFHATAFSILFKKEFYCIPPESGRERTDSLLYALKLQNRIVEDDEEIRIIQHSWDDNTQVILDEVINNSKRFIKEVLG